MYPQRWASRGEIVLRLQQLQQGCEKVTARLGLSACLLAGLALGGPARADAGSVVVTRTTASGVPILVMTVNLNDPTVKIAGMMSRYGSGHVEGFKSMIRRAHPTAAVTGTFFCTRSFFPIGDIVVDGQLAHRGGIGTGFCMTDQNDCEFVKPNHNYERVDWGKYDFVCCAGPRLVTNGVAVVHPGAEGFHD